MLRIVATFGLMLAATAPALAADHSGEGRWTWTWVAGGLISLSDTITSDVGMVRGTVARPGGVDTAVICTSLDTPGGAASGSCLHVDADGDKWLNDFACTPAASVPAGALTACAGTGTIRGGTGKFANVTGSSTFTIFVSGVLPDGSAVGYTTETYTMSY